MAESIVGATMRLSILGEAGRVDLVVPVWAEVGDVATSYADAVDAPTVPTLRRATGAPLAEDTPLEGAGLRHGSLLLADGRTTPAPGERRDGAAAPTRGVDTVMTGWLTGLGAVVLVVAAAAATAGSDPTLRAVTAGVLLAAGLLALAPLASTRARLQRLHVAPFCFAGSAYVLTGTSTDHALLPVAVAAIAALAAAAATRTLSDDAVSLVWLWATGTVAAAASVLLVLGSGPAGLWATLVAGALAAVRLLPTIVVDVPDETLLDLETLAVTAWSAHDEPRSGRRRRPAIRRREVRELAGRGGVLLRTGTAGAASVLAVAALLLLDAVDDLGSWAGLGAQVMVGAAAGATALVARTYRDWRLQALLRLTAAVLVVDLARVVLLEVSGPTLLVWVVGTVAVAAGVVGAALALGHGWRSVWWARVADIAQGCCLGVALAVLPLASGLFDFVWRFAS